jgi:uncharacterized membrane protein
LVVFTGALVLLVSGVINGTRGSQANHDDSRKPLEMLRQRYARGEIDKAEYEDIRRSLSA